MLIKLVYINNIPYLIKVLRRFKRPRLNYGISKRPRYFKIEGAWTLNEEVVPEWTLGPAVIYFCSRRFKRPRLL